MQALSEHLEAVKAGLPQKKPKVKEIPKSEKALIEARIFLDGALFKMDHHPMEVHSLSYQQLCHLGVKRLVRQMLSSDRWLTYSVKVYAS